MLLPLDLALVFLLLFLGLGGEQLLEEALELVQFNKDKENDEADPAISR